MSDDELIHAIEFVRKHGAGTSRDVVDALVAKCDRLAGLADWIIRKLKTMTEYYTAPTDNRDVVSEIQGWMHVLCFHYEQNRREVKEYDAARKEAKRLTIELEQANNTAATACKRFAEVSAELADLRAAAADALKYAGFGEAYPFDRLPQLIRDQRTKCRNDDDRDYWRFVEEQLAALLGPHTGGQVMTIDEHDEQMAQSVRHIRAVAEPFLVEQFGARCAEFCAYCECCARWTALDKLTALPEAKS